MLLVAAAVAGAGPGQAAKPVPDPLEVTTVDDLRFGMVAKEGAGDGWVTVGPTGGGAVSGGSLVALGGGSGPAVFEVVGVPYGVFQIDLPRRLRIDRDVIVTSFSSDPEWTGVLDGNGRATVRVGGYLDVAGRGSAGRYQSPFQIDVNYQ